MASPAGAGAERERMVLQSTCQAQFDGALRQFFPIKQRVAGWARLTRAVKHVQSSATSRRPAGLSSGFRSAPIRPRHQCPQPFTKLVGEAICGRPAGVEQNANLAESCHEPAIVFSQSQFDYLENFLSQGVTVRCSTKKSHSCRLEHRSNHGLDRADRAAYPRFNLQDFGGCAHGGVQGVDRDKGR